MPVLRRRTPTASPSDSSTVTVDLTKPEGKGRPTPKRNEALKQRKQAVRPPATRKEASALAKARMREERQARADGLRRGDESALPARDRGPVRRYVRDIVDSRFNVAEFFMPVIGIVILLNVIRPLAGIATYIWLITLVGLVVDSVVLRLRLKKLLTAKFPSGQTKGALAYGLLRALQFRKLRLPKPMVKRGALLD